MCPAAVIDVHSASRIEPHVTGVLVEVDQAFQRGTGSYGRGVAREHSPSIPLSTCLGEIPTPVSVGVVVIDR
jgi:hypothetical protein